MKLQYTAGLGLVALVLCFVGCAHDPYDPSIKPAASADVIKVVSMKVDPAKPVAPEPWRVTMKIKNISGQPLEKVTYRFLLEGRSEHLGEGEIPRLEPGASVNVTSQTAKVENGTYRVEGRVYLQNTKDEPEFNDRINNWMATNVVVAQ